MLGDNIIIRAKPTPKPSQKKHGYSGFAFFRSITDRFYRDPFKWGLIKCVAFFAVSVFAVRAISDSDILPAEPPAATQAVQSAY